MLKEKCNRNPVDLLGEDYLNRRRCGEDITVDQFAEMHPDFADEIRQTLPAIVALEQFKICQRSSSSPAQSIDLQLGETDQLGDFRIVQELGRGGMGVVFEAEQKTLGRRVAVKVFPRKKLTDQVDLDRFHREAKTAAGLHHTNIVQVFGFGQQDDLHYYVMQRIVGIPLDQLSQPSVKEPRSTRATHCREAVSPSSPTLTLRAGETDTERALPKVSATDLEEFDPHSATTFDWESHAIGHGRSEWQAVADIGIQVASALAHAHAQGVLHRDIKPSNLLLDAQGTVWVTDFGLATIMEAEQRDQPGEIAGTLRFMAPEHIGGKQDARSDVYSLGLTLYELLTKRPAFGDASRTSLVAKIIAGRIVPPRVLRPAIPADLEAIVMKATAKDPDHRYENAEAMAADLRRFISGRTVAARSVGPFVELARWARRSPAVAALAASLLAVAACSFALVSAKWRDAVAENERAEGNLSLALESMDQILERFGSGWMAHPVASETVEDSVSPDDLGVQIAVSDHNASVLQNALVFYDRFEELNPTSPRLHNETAKVHRRVGDIYHRLGQHDRAEAAYRRSFRYATGQASDLGFEQTLELLRTRNSLALTLFDASRFEESRNEYRTALQEIAQSRHHADAELRAVKAQTLTNLAKCLSRMFRSREALNRQREAVAVIEGIVDEQDSRNSSHRLALALSYRGYYTLSQFDRSSRSPMRETSLESIRKSGIRILEQLVEDHPGVPDYRCELSDMLVTTGFHVHHGPDRNERIADLERGVQLARELCREHPSIPRYRAILGKALMSMARLHRNGHRRTAEALLVESSSVYRALTQEFADIPAYRILLAWSLSDQIDNLRAMGRRGESLPLILDAINQHKAYLQLRPGRHHAKMRLVKLYRQLAETHDHLGDYVEADAARQKASEYLWMGSNGKPFS